MKGLLVFVQGMDCTNNGVTSGKEKAVLIGDGIPEIFEPSEDAPPLFLHYELKPVGARAGRLMVAKPEWLEKVGAKNKEVRMDPFSSYPDQCQIVRAVAKPADYDECMSMYGGHDVGTSDSRFPFTGPIPVHDRIE